MKEYVILVDEAFAGFSPGQQQQKGAFEAPATSTLAGAQEQAAQEV
jgi:hypothetical protein